MNFPTAALGVDTLQLVANKLKIGKAERRFAEGKWWLVAPITTIPADGILNGSRGPGFYPSAETQATVKAWDGMPLTSFHPMDELGRHTSAGAPGVLDRQGIGIVRDSVWKNKLQHRGWFDEERVKRVNPTIHYNLANGIPIETSTGLYTDNVPAPKGSSHNGRPYTWVARNHRPDHIAVLIGQVGACSLNDGCGVLVNVAGNPTSSALVTNQAVTVAHWVENACICGGTCGRCRPTLNSLGVENAVSLVVNPFVSESQRRACYAQEDPNWDCEEWSSATPKGKKLPERLGGSRPSVENLSSLSFGNLHTRPSLLAVLNFDPDQARGEGGKWVYAGAAGDRGKELHRHSQAAHDAVTGLAIDSGLDKHLADALATSGIAAQESSIGNHANASKYHLAAATQLNQAANKVGRSSFWNSVTFGLAGRRGDTAAADKIREAASKHLYAGGESGGGSGFGEASALTDEAHGATKTADKHKVAWLHHAAVNAHLKASQAWKDEAEKHGDEGLKKVLGTIAADHQRQAWEHGKSASQAEVGGSGRAAPRGSGKGKYEFLKLSTNQLGLGKPSLLEVKNFNPFHDLKGKFATAGGAIGAGIGKATGKTVGAVRGALRPTPGLGRGFSIRHGAYYTGEAGERVGRAVGKAVGGVVGGLVEKSATLAGGAAGTLAGLGSKIGMGLHDASQGLSDHLDTAGRAVGRGIDKAGRGIAKGAIATVKGVDKTITGVNTSLEWGGRVSSATLLHGLAGGLEAATSSGKPSPYAPSVAPIDPSKEGKRGTGKWTDEYQGAVVSSSAKGVHAFSLDAQRSATAPELNLDLVGKFGKRGSDMTQKAYRLSQLGDHGEAALKHVEAAELCQRAAEDLKTWQLKALQRPDSNGRVAPIPPAIVGGLGERDRQALRLESLALKNRIAAIIQGNNPITESARLASVKAAGSVRSADKKDSPKKHANAARVNLVAKEAWEGLVRSEHNPIYKKTYETLAQYYASIAKAHNDLAIARLGGN